MNAINAMPAITFGKRASYDEIRRVIGDKKAAEYRDALGQDQLEEIGLTFAERLPDWVVAVGKRIPFFSIDFYRPGEKVFGTGGGFRTDPRETAVIEKEKAKTAARRRSFSA